MAVGPLEQAFVEIQGDVSRLDSDLDAVFKRLTSLEGLGRQVSEAIETAFARAGEQIEDAFREAARQSEAALREIGGPDSFGLIPEQAAQVGEDIEDAFREAARGANEDLRDIGDPEVFVPIGAAAEGAGEQVEGSFREAARGANEDIRDIGNAGQFAGLVVASEAAAESMERSFRDSSRDSIRAISRIGAAGGGLSLIATGFAGVGIAAAAAGAATVGFGLVSSANLEQNQIGFEALLGSAEEADAFIREMQEFAAETPFEFAGLANNTRQLLAVSEAIGVTRDEIIPTIGIIGDLTSVLGAPPEAMDSVIRALGQMGSRGKVTSEEMLQLAEALPGFQPFAAMAEGLDVTTAELQDMISDGAVPAEEGIAALIDGMANFEGAAGAMERQSQTLLGVFSTFKDTIALTLTEAFQPLVPTVTAALGEATPAIETAIGAIAPALATISGTVLQGVVAVIDQLGPAFGEALQSLADGFASLGETSAPLLGSLVPVIGILGSLGPALAEAGPAITAIGEAFGEVVQALSPAIATTLAALASAASAFITALPPTVLQAIVVGFLAFRGAAAALAVFNAAMSLTALNPWILAIAAVAAAAFLVVQNWGPISEFFVGLWDSITAAFRTAVDFILNNPFVTGLVIGLIITHWSTLVSFFQGAWSAIVVAAQTAFAALQVGFEFLGAVFTGVIVPAVQGVVAVLSFLWTSVLTPIASFLTAVLVPAFRILAIILFGPLIAAISAVIIIGASLYEFVLRPVASFLAGVLGPAIRTVASVLSGTFSAAISFARTLLFSFWTNVLQPVAGFLSGVLRSALVIVSDGWSRLRSAAGTARDVLNAIWQNVIVPLARTLRGAFESAIDTAAGAWRTFRSAIDPVVGILENIIGAAGRVIDAIGDVADAISNLPGAGVVSDIVGAIPGFQHGGIVDEDMLAMLHRPEVVIPLNDPNRALQLANQSGLFETLARASSFARRPTGALVGATGRTATESGNVVVRITNYFDKDVTPDQGAAVGAANADAVQEVLDRRAARAEARIA